MHSTALRYFLEVSECSSIRQAAERLHVAPSALSRQLAKLEHELGTALLERQNRGVVPTEAGKLLAAFGVRSAKDLEQVRSQIDDLTGLRKGVVTIATVEAMVAEFLPHCLAAFQARHPGIVAKVNVVGTHDVAEAVQRNEVDLGIAFGSPRRPNLTVQASLSQPLHAILAPGHPLATRKTAFLKEFRHVPIALPDRSFGIRQMVDKVSMQAAFGFSQILETNSLEMAKALVRHSHAATFMPLLTVMRDLQLGALVAVPLRDDIFSSTSIDVLTATDRALSRASLAFLAALSQAALQFKDAIPTYRRNAR